MCFSGLLPGTGCLLGRFSILLLWALAPHDYVIYCQARGLSGHTSPAVNVLFLTSGLRPRTGCLLGWSFTILLLWTLAPHDYVTYCQARGLSGHTSPCGECAFLISGLRSGASCLLG